MAKHAKKSDHLQLVDVPKTTIVEIPLPLLGALANIEQTFFESRTDYFQTPSCKSFRKEVLHELAKIVRT